MSKLKSNLFFQIVYQLFAIIIPLITAPYITRIFIPSDEGVISYAYSFTYYFIIAAMLGLNTYGNRTIAMNRDDKDTLSKIFIEIQCMHFILSILSIIIFYSVISFIPDNRTIFMVSSIYLIASAFDISWFYFGLENVKNIVIKNFLIKIITTILIFTLIKEPSDINKYVYILSGGTALGHLSLWIGIHRFISFKRISIKGIFCHLKPLLILAIPIISMNIYKYMDKIMLKWIADYSSVGLYENSEKITNVLMSIITAIGLVLLPYSAKLAKNNEFEKLKQNMKYSIYYVMPLTFLMMFGLAAISLDLAPVYLGEKYKDCGPLILGLSFSLVFTCISNVVRSQYLMPLKKDKEYIVSLIAGALVNVVANSILIMYFGAIGAVIGTVLAEATVCITQLILIRKEISLLTPIIKSIPFFLISLIMFLGVMYFSTKCIASWKSIVFEIIIGAILFISLSFSYELFIDCNYICDLCIIFKLYNTYFVIRKINYFFTHRSKMIINFNKIYIFDPKVDNDVVLEYLFDNMNVDVVKINSISQFNNGINILSLCNEGHALGFDILASLVNSADYQLYFNSYDLNGINNKKIAKIIKNLVKMRGIA